MSETLRAALNEALDDEYRAEAMYEAGIAAFGPVRPFVQVAEAQRRRVDMLLQVFERHGFDPPPNRWRGTIDLPTDVSDACRAAMAHEAGSVALYDRLMVKVADDEDVARLFLTLRRASQARHLPAFASCIQAGGSSAVSTAARKAGG